MKKFIPVLLLLAFMMATAANAQNYVLVANESVAETSLSKDDVSHIFLKTKTKWSDGSAITPVDQSARAAVREAFSQDVHGRGVGAIRSHWQQAAFSGAGTAPIERGNDADVVAFVKSNPGAVGYVSTEAATDGVKVIAVN